MADEPQMPELVKELASMINRMPHSTHWRRLRIAITEEESNVLRTYFFKTNENRTFYWAIRGVPLVLEDHPLQPMYLMEKDYD